MSTENQVIPANETSPTTKKRSRKDLSNFANAQTGDNAKYLRHALAAWNLPPIDLDNDEQVAERVLWYFEHCIEDDIKPSVTGLANALGCCRDTLWRWKTGRSRAESDGHSDTIKKAYNLLEQMDAEGLRDGKTNPAAGIFLLKNNHGYQDKQDLVLTPNNPLGDTYNPEQIAEAIEMDLIED